MSHSCQQSMAWQATAVMQFNARLTVVPGPHNASSAFWVPGGGRSGQVQLHAPAAFVYGA